VESRRRDHVGKGLGLREAPDRFDQIPIGAGIARDRAADDRAIEDRAADDRATGYPGGPEPERTSRNG